MIDLKLPPITYPLRLLGIYAAVACITGALFLIGATTVEYPLFAAAFALRVIADRLEHDEPV